MGVTTQRDPTDSYGAFIDTNIEEGADEKIIDLGDATSYNEFVNEMIEYLQLVSEAYLRTYTEMLEGAPAFSCPMYYRVNKFQRLNGQRGNLIQTVVIPQYTTVKDKIFNYVDTQLRYNQDYEYEIMGYNAVIGSKYRFAELYLPVYTDGGACTSQIQYYGPPVLAGASPSDRARLSFERPDERRVTLTVAEPDAYPELRQLTSSTG